MRCVALAAVSLLLSTGCGASNTATEANAPVAVAEVALEAEGSSANEAPAQDDLSAKTRGPREEFETSGLVPAMDDGRADGLRATLDRSSMDGRVTNALEGLSGAPIGEGAGGLGLRGTSMGGGSGQGTSGATAGYSTGLSLIDTRGPASGGIGLASASTPLPQATLGTPSVQGQLAAGVVRRILNGKLGAIRACYAKEQVLLPQLAGEVRIAFVIAPDGQLGASRVASSTLRNDAVERCVLGRVRGMSFPRPERGLVLVEVGVTFSPPAPSPPATPAPAPPASAPASSAGAP